eukprot:364100-Chlamydomonas_euryale.AAC.80
MSVHDRDLAVGGCPPLGARGHAMPAPVCSHKTSMQVVPAAPQLCYNEQRHAEFVASERQPRPTPSCEIMPQGGLKHRCCSLSCVVRTTESLAALSLKPRVVRRDALMKTLS